MFALRSDMSGLDQICPVWGAEMSGHQKLHVVKKYIGSKDNASRSR
jgi:hypothetical protein